MWVVVLVTDEDALAGSSHAMLLIVVLKAPESCSNGGVFFWLSFLGAKSVVAEWI